MRKLLWRHRIALTLVFIAGAILAAGCTQQIPSQPQPSSGTTPTQGRSPSVVPVNLKSLPDTIGLEYQDRIRRFDRLSKMLGVNPPQLDELQLDVGQIPGVNYPIPVVRIIFSEKVFFDFNQDVLKPEAERIVDVIAENMKRDVPDAQLLLLGHTDAIGSDAYNIDLSRRRAQRVLSELIVRGVASSQLEAIAIGKRQPIAPNWTEEGRALNRRVEFMLSASKRANERLVEKRPTNLEYLKTGRDEPMPLAPSPTISVLVPNQSSLTAPSAIEPRQPDAQLFELRETSTIEIRPQPKPDILRTPEPAPQTKLAEPMEYKQRQIDEEFSLN